MKNHSERTSFDSQRPAGDCAGVGDIIFGRVGHEQERPRNYLFYTFYPHSAQNCP